MHTASQRKKSGFLPQGIISSFPCIEQLSIWITKGMYCISTLLSLEL